MLAALLTWIASAHATCMAAFGDCAFHFVAPDCTPLSAQPEDGPLRFVAACPGTTCCAVGICSTEQLEINPQIWRVEGEAWIQTGLSAGAVGQCPSPMGPQRSGWPAQPPAPPPPTTLWELDRAALAAGQYAVGPVSLTVAETDAALPASPWPMAMPVLSDGRSVPTPQDTGEVGLWVRTPRGEPSPIWLAERAVEGGWRLASADPTQAWLRQDHRLLHISGAGGQTWLRWRVLDGPPDRWWQSEAPCPEGTALVGPQPVDWRDEGLAMGGEEVFCAGPDGRREGPWSRWGEPGYSEQGTFVAGQKEGVFFLIRPEVSRHHSYRAGVPDGLWRDVHASGEVTLEGVYRQGRRDGAWIDAGAGYRVEDTWCDGTRCGLYREYDLSGHERARGLYVAGLQEGSWTFSEYPGHREVVSLHHGARSGTSEVWIGETRVLRETWADGERHGPSYAWNEYGQPLEAGQYSHGVRTGTWVVWHPDSQPRRERVRYGQPRP